MEGGVFVRTRIMILRPDLCCASQQPTSSSDRVCSACDGVNGYSEVGNLTQCRTISRYYFRLDWKRAASITNEGCGLLCG